MVSRVRFGGLDDGLVGRGREGDVRVEDER